MFKCDNCKKNERRQQKLVTQIRSVTYQLRLKIIRTKMIEGEMTPQQEESYRELRRTSGTEIAKELRLCSKCFSRLENTKPKLVGSEVREVIVKTLVNPRNSDRRQGKCNFHSSRPRVDRKKSEANNGKPRQDNSKNK